MKHRHRPRPDPHVTTRALVENSDHFAKRDDQLTHYPMCRVSSEEAAKLRAAAGTVRGIPEHYAYEGGQITVWPLPAVGWEVWSVHGVRIPTA